jgi:hypothetical protein
MSTEPQSRSSSNAEPNTDGVRLTDYEVEQVRQIAIWKSAHPNVISELVKNTTLPLARVVERVIPDAIVQAAIEKAYDAADRLAAKDDLIKKANVRTFEELKHKSLEQCDQYALAVGVGAQGISLIEGALTGAGGAVTTAVDIPLLFTLALRTIIKIGHCYGYALDQDIDQRYVLQVLIIGASGTSASRMERLEQLREIEELAVEEAQEMIVTEEVASFLFQLEEFEAIPGIGAISGSLLNYIFIRKIEVAARRVFQERWLRQSGKVHEIDPAPIDERVPVGGRFRDVLGRAVYRACYYVGFGATLPIALIAAAIPPRDNAVRRGFRDGAAAAAADVARVTSRSNGELEPSHTQASDQATLATT